MASTVLLFGDVDRLACYAGDEGGGAPAIRAVAGGGHCIPVVCSPEKTRAEIERLQQDLGFAHPFISENGAALFVPRGYFPFGVPRARLVAGYEAVEFGWRHPDVVAAVRRVARESDARIVGFSEMSVEEVAEECGVTLLQARLAKLREYSEPVRLVSTQPKTVEAFFKGLQAARLVRVPSGRYEQVGGPTDASAGVRLLTAMYRRLVGHVITVGLGEAERDRALLRTVDVPVVVGSPAAGHRPGGGAQDGPTSR